jgi:hypothetical protein
MQLIQRLSPALVTAIALGLVSPARASDNPLADTIGRLMTRERPTRSPQLLVAGGITGEGVMVDVAAGYGWGTHDRGFLLPGTSLRRVLIGARAGRDAALVRAMFGYTTNSFGMLSADVGVEAQVTGTPGLGPMLQSTLGWHGVGMRSSCGLLFDTGGDVRVTAAMELVVDVMDVIGRY